MRVLVSGASGLLGTAICERLVARGDEVVGLSRDPERARARNRAVEWQPWDGARERPPRVALEGVEAVVNLVGEPLDQRWTEDAKRRIRESRERATKNLVDAMLAADPAPRALVSQSAVGYYGDRGDELVDEAAGPGAGFDSQVCVAWESAARDAERAGIRTAITRTGLVLDPAGGLLKRVLLPFRLGLGGPIAGGRQYMPWIHRDDEIALLLFALDSEDATGTFNATAPNPATSREFARTLGRVLRRPALIPVPKLALAALFGSELAATACGGQRAIPRRALDAGFEFRFAELEPALGDLLG